MCHFVSFGVVMQNEMLLCFLDSDKKSIFVI